MQLILLSAGRGSRLSKELRSKPKSLAKVNDKPIIEHNLNIEGTYFFLLKNDSYNLISERNINSLMKIALSSNFPDFNTPL